MALILLFKLSTREDWMYVMYDLSRTPPDCIPGETCGSCITYIF